MQIRFKRIKQDRRLERATLRGDAPEAGQAAHGGGDWATVGDVPTDPQFSVFLWYRRLMTFYPNGRQATDPFFQSHTGGHPYTYSQALRDLRTMLRRHGTDVAYGLHGLRVTGYNLSREANGQELTVAHGGWQSDAHYRYQRFALDEVANMAARMVDADAPYGLPQAAADLAAARAPVTRGEASAAAAPPPVRAADGEASAPEFSDSEGEVGDPSPDRTLRSAGVSVPPVVAGVPVPTTVGASVRRHTPPRTRAGRGGRGASSSA